MKLFTFGCSFTEGQELKEQATECYSHLIAKNLKIDYFNFGACGASNDYIFRKVFELLNSETITKDDIIVIQWTHYIRKELLFEYEDKEFYHYVPTSLHAYDDKVIITDSTFFNKPTVQNNYINQNLDKIRKNIESKNEEFLNIYNLKFLNENYQKNTTINYINSLYTYLEHFDYKHLHFFGWDKCIVESIFDNKKNFIKETFGGYTKTKQNQHPNKESHNKWAEFLSDKIIQFKFVDEFENQINNYRKNLSKLKIEIEDEIPNLFKNRMDKLKIAIANEIEIANDKIKHTKQLELEKQLKEIKKQKESELEKELNGKKAELEKIEKHLKEKIKTISNLPKSLI
jgi:hypothetical protein